MPSIRKTPSAARAHAKCVGSTVDWAGSREFGRVIPEQTAWGDLARTTPVRTACVGARRGGYTLIEVLLALAVLLTMATMVWPSLTRMFMDHNLRSSVDKVRVHLAGTRMHALNDSWTYQFRFEPNGQKYIVLPYELQTATSTQSTSSSNESGPQPFRLAGQLPDEINFQNIGDEDFVIERLSEDWLSGLSSTEDLSDVSWSTPVLFFPDGTATPAQFQIVDSNNQLIRVWVRGLTGAVSVSSVELEDER